MQDKTVLDGVYTAEKASRGEAEYEKNCLKCHEGADADGPTLMGKSFLDRWREDNLDLLFKFIKKRMPRNQPGKLPDSAYIDILTYILRANSFPDGPKELTPDALETTRIVGKDGPKPLPTNTLINVFGCLTPTPDNAWTLTHATDPVRHRGWMEPAEETKTPDGSLLGIQIFKLQNFSNIDFDFKPDPYSGQKVRITGVLIRQPNNDRISVTSLETVAATCP